MNNRILLHKTKLEAFKLWLDSHGIAHRPGKGDYQALQVLSPESGWQVVFTKNEMPEHYTVNAKLVPIVRNFIASQHERTSET